MVNLRDIIYIIYLCNEFINDLKAFFLPTSNKYVTPNGKLNKENPSTSIIVIHCYTWPGSSTLSIIC